MGCVWVGEWCVRVGQGCVWVGEWLVDTQETKGGLVLYPGIPPSS